tara:strand:+ start:214 stop:453 length:240 start_codon:yes stop_codon:yes gene_type:complete
MAETKQAIKKEIKPPVKVVKEKKSLEVKTPYPKEEKKKSDVDFIGEELVKLSNRLNEAELSISDLQIKLNQARVRLGLE